MITVHFSPKEAALEAIASASEIEVGSNFPEETDEKEEVAPAITSVSPFPTSSLFSRSVAVSYNDTFHTILWEYKLEVTREDFLFDDVSIFGEDEEDSTTLSPSTSNTLQNYLISVVFCLSTTFSCRVLQYN